MRGIVHGIVLLSILMIGCVKGPQLKNLEQSTLSDTIALVASVTVEKSLLYYNKEESLWLQDEQPYSGYIVSYYPDSMMQESICVLEGKKQNVSVRWYPDGHVKQVANYQGGKLHGEKKSWSAGVSHRLISHLNYRMGKAHGEQKQWYETGELYKSLELVMGKEDGLQQAFRKNGDLYANYEAKNGRIFGLRKASLCYGLEDESIINEE